ncbi:MAG: 50S ribosomal protein L25/general stress protein Ctc [Alphaproteobacteria bacterium]|nr:50S ribosomal protein L25/general stress protein Ctc [Alphaproteobacteria bacterium]
MSKTLKVTKRERAGKGAARAIRLEQKVPGVVYGAKQEPTIISIDPRDVMKELATGVFFNTVYDIEIDGKQEKVLPRDVQMHVVKDSVQHIDLMRVEEKTKVTVSVPVEYVGIEKNEAVRMGGNLQIVRREVELLAIANLIPEKLTIDVSKIRFGGIVRMSNIKLQEGLSPTITDRDFVLASLKSPRGVSADDVDGEVVDENEEARKEQEAEQEAKQESEKDSE